MTQANSKNKRLVGLFLLGVLFFNYPLLSLFNHHSSVFGIPILYFYIFSVWTSLIAMMIVITTCTGKGKKNKQVETGTTGEIGTEKP